MICPHHPPPPQYMHRWSSPFALALHDPLAVTESGHEESGAAAEPTGEAKGGPVLHVALCPLFLQMYQARVMSVPRFIFFFVLEGGKREILSVLVAGRYFFIFFFSFMGLALTWLVASGHHCRLNTHSPPPRLPMTPCRVQSM